MGKKKNGGYEDHFQHIEDMTERVSALLDVRMLEKELRSLETEDTEELDTVRKKLAASRRKLTLLGKRLEKKVGETQKRGEVELPFCTISAQSGLSGTEMRILELLLCNQAHDELHERACELSGRMKTVTLKTVLDILGGTLEEKAEIRKLIGPLNPLFSTGLVLLERAGNKGSESDFLEMRLYISCRTYGILMGQDPGNVLLEPYSELVTGPASLDELVLPAELKGNLVTLLKCRKLHGSVWRDWGLESIRPFRKGTVLVLSGPEGSGRRTLACALAGEMGLKCLHVRMDRILTESDGPVDVCRQILGEAGQQDAVALVTDTDLLFHRRNTAELDAFRRSLLEHEGITIITVGESVHPAEHFDGCVVWNVEIPVLESPDREKLWRRLLPEGIPLADDVDLRRLAMENEMNAGEIQEAIVRASMNALADGRVTDGIRQEDLLESSRSSVRSSRARQKGGNRVMLAFSGGDDEEGDGEEGYLDIGWSSVSMNDVILPSNTRRQVMDIIAAVHNQEKVFEDWGFGEFAGSGHCISALFMGESGTGKTMTAEAIASELGRKLCTVRGSSVISKWVGESEKNVVRVFRESDENDVLFFDEAESIFTSRVEVDDAHSEMINRRVSCLLREIEMRRGVIILATNYPGVIDGAFQRRMRFKIEFPRPDREEREAIWRVNVPKKVPISDDIDFGLLAGEYDFTGGQIRSILLRAAFSAAEMGSNLGQELILQAAEDEIPLVEKKDFGYK